jgi:type IV pilus assembly protein PilW
MKRSPNNEGGFSLIELLVALVVGMFVLAATIGLVTINQRSHFVQEQVVGSQQHARIALDMMARDLRMAGYNPLGVDPDVFATSVPANGAITFPFVLKMDANNNGALDPGETVSYAYIETGDDAGKITRNGVAVTPQQTVVPVNGVPGISLTTKTSGGLTRVTLTITTRTANEDPYFAGGVNVTGTSNDGTARLRRLSTTVTLRNTEGVSP